MTRRTTDPAPDPARAAAPSRAPSLSYVLEPTPYQYVRVRDYGRVRVEATMHAVDYAIVAMRVGGVVALMAGGYLTYRSLRPDRIDESVPPPLGGAR